MKLSTHYIDPLYLRYSSLRIVLNKSERAALNRAAGILESARQLAETNGQSTDTSADTWTDAIIGADFLRTTATDGWLGVLPEGAPL